MVRTLIVSLVCLAVALLGISGMHAHIAGVAEHGGEHAPAAGEHVHHEAYSVSILDANHAADHDDDGDVDIDPLTKAFGTHSLTAPVLWLVFWCGLIILGVRAVSLVIPPQPPLRPPRWRSRLFLLPPSQAPPTLLA